MPAPATAREPAPASDRAIGRLAVAVEVLRQRLLTAEQEAAKRLAEIPAARRASACNLIHYIALRSQDLRRLQRDLALNGLSSLGRCEAHVLASVERLRSALRAMLGQREKTGDSASLPVDQRSGPHELSRQAQAVFGPSPAARAARIMVTLPSEAGGDPELIERLMGAGMDLARINCAHDDEAMWLQMIRLVRETAAAQGRQCRILMDLAGPKLRTGALAGGEAVLTWGPERDHLGRVVAAARVALVPKDHLPTSQVQVVVPLMADLSQVAEIGDLMICRDARGKRRRARVVHVTLYEVIIEAEDTTYVVPGTVVHLERSGRRVLRAEVAALPISEEPLLLTMGDTLIVTADQTPGRPAKVGNDGAVSEPARMPCSLPEVLAQVKVGERICFDDGKIDGLVRQADATRLEVEIIRARDGGAKLRSDKGINLPDSKLALPCLTAVDRQHLAFAKRHADLIGLSFVHRASDVSEVVEALGKVRRTTGVVLKIETPQAFTDLPDILLAALGRIPMGVMVARGDLAVEVGFARLAEVQEEILWLCEAAHLPVIWGTQVLETLAKKGMAIRAEVIDAAMSVRAECVMLNKGPHIVDAVLFLDDVLVRMQQHQANKRTLLRRLGVTESLEKKRRKHHA
ncbi:MAG TPA: pyruvate kinase [Planctomycetota bacterium]|nr:pyruvate kinase [Planctomycetota bacterium]